MRSVLRISLIISLVVVSGVALAANLPQAARANGDPVFDARIAADELRKATRALSETTEARDRVAALSRVVRAYEDGLRAMREALRRAAIKEQALKLEFANRRAQLARLIGVLQSLGRVPAPLVLIHPSGALATAESGQILSDVTPALYREVQDLRTRLRELQVLQGLQKSALEDVQNGLNGVQQARVALAEAIGRRTRKLPPRLASDPARLQQLARNSDTLTSFAAGLSDLPIEGFDSPGPDFASARGKLPLPVFGTLLHGFNQADAAGIRRPGIVIAAPPVSLVTTPWAATIRYRGPLLDYGNVIILEPQAGYLIILAGLGQIYGEVGQILSAGDPVGLLQGAEPAARDFLVETAGGSGDIRQETLYIEIRKDRKPVDPAAWFALKDR